MCGVVPAMAGGTVVFAAGLAPANPVDSTVIINLNVKSTDAIAHRVHTEGHRPLSGVHSIRMEKFAQAGEGGERCTPTPLSLHLPSRSKLQCTFQLSGQIYSP